MNDNRTAFAERAVEGWVSQIQRYRYDIIIAFALLILYCGIYIKDNISMSTDISNMLSEYLPWRKLDIAYDKLFPQFQDNMLIVIEANTPDAAADTATILYDDFIKHPHLIEDIYYPAQLRYFRQSSLLFKDEDNLYRLSDRLATIQPFIGTLLEDRSLRGLFNMLEQALAAIKDGEDIDIDLLLKEINRTINDSEYRASWQKLMSPDDSGADIYREFIMLKTLEADNELLPGEAVMKSIRQRIEKLGLEQYAYIRLSGNTALSYEELNSVTEANLTAIVTSLLLITVILIIGLSSVWLFISSMCSLLAGLIATTAFAAATVGELNLISVAFAVLYIGLGIDFAIHVCLRYQEEAKKHIDAQAPLSIALSQIFRTLLLCTLTTTIGFYSFIPTDYRGVAELGWIAGSGMLISMCFSFTLLPALLSLKKPVAKSAIKQDSKKNGFSAFIELPYRYPGSIIIIATFIFLLVLSQTHRITFDTNTLNLQDPSNESVQVYQDLLRDSDTSPWRGLLLKSHDEAPLIKQKLEQRDVVDSIIWVEDLVPNDQEEKLFLIDDMSLMMGPLSINEYIEPLEHADRQKAIQQLLASLNRLPPNQRTDAINMLEQNLKTLANETVDASLLASLETRLLIHLDGRIASLTDALAAEEVSFDDIPESVLQRWVNGDYYKIEIIPKYNLNVNKHRTDFVRQLQEYDNELIGPPVISVEAGAAVMHAFRDALIYALIAITILLIILIKKRTDALIILASVILGGAFTIGLMLISGISFNFANIIGLPLLMGIGVDSGIHIANRFRQEQHNGINIFTTSASRGVFVSSLTTICSIGNLAFSAHTGTASMGLMLVLGLFAMFVATMCVLPAFMIWQTQSMRK